tara:strand:- start:1673 stop:2593 length:921 start_codon:yes stop_codon:yes gene_type:complete
MAAKKYVSDYIDQISIDSNNWTPNREDYVSMLNKFSSFIFENDCYWGWKASDRIGEVFDDKMFCFVWENMKQKRPYMVDTLINDFKGRPVCSEELRMNVLNNLYDSIPRNNNLADNKLRRDLVKLLSPDYNYMDEIFSLRLIDQEGTILSGWHQQGLCHSKDPAFYAYCWSLIKRSSGYIDKKIMVAKNMFNSDILSEKIIKDSASKGTKKLKRFIVEQLGCKMDYYQRKLRYMEEDDALYSFYEDKNSSLESYILLFANFDDSNSLSIMSDSLSVDNLPWIMPMLGKYHWISRNVERRIAQKENH